jgi:hypothetical protein
LLDKGSDQTSTQISSQIDGDDKGKPAAKAARLYNYKWTSAAPQFKAWLLTVLGLIDGRYQLSDVTTQVDICDLDWYEDYRLVRLTDPEWGYAKLRLYFLVGPESDLFRLNGTSPPIHEVNAKAPIKLNADNVLSYLIFFCFFVWGEEGPFYVLESIDDPVIEEFKKVAPDNELMETTLAVFEGTVRNAQLVNVTVEGNYQCEAVISYSNAIFTANFIIFPTGMIEMLEDEPIAADMPFRVDLPIA